MIWEEGKFISLQVNFIGATIEERNYFCEPGVTRISTHAHNYFIFTQN